METQIDVSIYEAFFGMEKKISLRTINGKMKTFTVKIPAGIRNGEKNTFIRARKVRRKRWKKWRFSCKDKFKRR